MRVDISNLKKILLFLIKLNILSIPLYLSFVFSWEIRVLQIIEANLVRIFLGLFGISTETLLVNNLFVVVSNGDLNFWVDGSCNGLRTFLAALAVIGASFYKLNRKIKMILISIPLILALNQFRLFVSALLLFRVSPLAFNLWHNWTWSALTFLVLTILFKNSLKETFKTGFAKNKQLPRWLKK